MSQHGENFRSKFENFIGSRKTFFLLLTLNFIFSIIVFYVYRNLTSGDETHYINYGLGIAHGRYSYWWFLPQYIPDTLRNPGYPFFIFFIISIWNNIYFIKLIQLALYFFSIFIILKISEEYHKGYELKNLFLLILLPGIQIAVLSATIQPEALMVFLVACWIWLSLKMKNNISKYAALGLLAGIIFQVRPVFLFVPLIFTITDIAYNGRSRLPGNAVMLCLYILSMIPYGMWNYKHHRVFSITPLESGAGVMQAGYWSFLMPGYKEPRYWKNIMVNEIISFTDPSEIPGNIAAYNKEWDYIDSSCTQFLTKQDSVNLIFMNKFPYLFKTYSAGYTQAREKLIRKFTLDHLKSDLWFTFKIKTYTFFRLWISNFRPTSSLNQSSKDLAGAFYSFIVSLTVFLLSIILIPAAFIKKRLKIRDHLFSIVLILYFGLIHIPFSIQSRYTTPVRMILFLLLAMAILSLIKKKDIRLNPGSGV